MKFKEFFKPTKWKMIILIILLIVSTLLSPRYLSCNPTEYGFPLKFFQFSECVDISPCAEGYNEGPIIVCESIGFNSNEGVIAFIINLAFWYLFSCIIIFIYNKLRSKK